MSEGESGGSNATALSGLANQPLVNGQTAAQYYATFLTQLGSTVSQVSDENTTQQASLTQLTTQQGAESSVSLDQEASNLTLYERSYDAAAKVFTIVDELDGFGAQSGRRDDGDISGTRAGWNCEGAVSARAGAEMRVDPNYVSGLVDC